jgi:hypothetical protein
LGERRKGKQKAGMKRKVEVEKGEVKNENKFTANV